MNINEGKMLDFYDFETDNFKRVLNKDKLQLKEYQPEHSMFRFFCARNLKWI